MKSQLAAFVCGLLFAPGLGIAGMTRPEKIIGFLDVNGRWDPDLLWVMAAAISVTALGYRWTLRRDHADQIAGRIVQLGGEPNFSPEGLWLLPLDYLPAHRDAGRVRLRWPGDAFFSLARSAREPAPLVDRQKIPAARARHWSWG